MDKKIQIGVKFTGKDKLKEWRFFIGFPLQKFEMQNSTENNSPLVLNLNLNYIKIRIISGKLHLNKYFF